MALAYVLTGSTRLDRLGAFMTDQGMHVSPMMLAAVGLLLVGFVGVKLYERLFVLPVTGLSTITLDGMDLRAISPGQLDFVNPAATKGEIAFGSQIRSYVFQPYTMVNDHRTELKVGDVQRVMDGDLDAFIHAWLKRAGGRAA